MKVKKSYVILLVFSLLILAAAALVFVRANNDLAAPASDRPTVGTVLADDETPAAASPYYKTEDEFLQAIKKQLCDGYQEITADKWKADYGDALAAPGFLPGSYKYYSGVFIKPDPGIPEQTMTMQLWYDPVSFEILTINQEPTEAPDSTGLFDLTRVSLEEVLHNLYPWAEYRGTYQMYKDCNSIYGFMLINGVTSKEECERIFESIKITG